MSQCHDEVRTDPLAAAHPPLRARDVMTAHPITVEPTATVKEIAHVLLHHDIRAVPVVDIGDVLLGVVSEADLLCRECPTVRHHSLGQFLHLVHRQEQGWADKAEGVTAGEVMTKSVVSCAPAEPVSVAARRMLSEDVRLLPVVDDGRLVGVVSRHDILRLFDRPDSEVRQRIADLLTSPLWAPEGHHIAAEVKDGIVHLSGSVQYASDAHAVVSLVGALPGVIEVKNEMTSELPEPKPHYLRDTDWR